MKFIYMTKGQKYLPCFPAIRKDTITEHRHTRWYSCGITSPKNLFYLLCHKAALLSKPVAIEEKNLRDFLVLFWEKLRK